MSSSRTPTPSSEQRPRARSSGESTFYRWAALVGIGGSALVGGGFGFVVARASDGSLAHLAGFTLGGAVVGAVLGLWKLVPYESLAIDLVLGLFRPAARD